MNVKSAHHPASTQLTKQSFFRETLPLTPSTNQGCFKCLNDKDVLTAKVSDHHPVIHDETLFWNVMMQGRLRGGSKTEYNNAFSIIETEEDYLSRLQKVAEVIAEIIKAYPVIEAIALCEGPNKPLYIDTLLNALKRHQSMKKFFKDSVIEDNFHKPNLQGANDWGLLMLADKKYQVMQVAFDFMNSDQIFKKLANRFQIWQLTDNRGEARYLALGHFPFGGAGDAYKTNIQHLSKDGKAFCQLVREVMAAYSEEKFVLCADFNINPYLISEWQDREKDMVAQDNRVLSKLQSANS